MKLVRNEVMNKQRSWFYTQVLVGQQSETWWEVFSNIWIYCEGRLGVDHGLFGNSFENGWQKDL